MGNHSSHSPRNGEGGGRGNAESSYHFTNHCTRSFRIERILIFANLAERQGEVKSRGYAITTSRRLRRVQLLPLHRSACTPPRRKNGNELPRNSQAARLPPPSPSRINRGPGNNKRKADGEIPIAFRLGIKREDSRILFLTTIPTVCVIEEHSADVSYNEST